LTTAQSAEVRERLASNRRVVAIGESLVAGAVLDRLAAALVSLLEQHHRAMPLSEGMPREEARERLCAHAAAGVFERVIDDLVASQRIVARERLALATHRLALTPAEAEARAGLERIYQERALAPLSLAEAAAAVGVAQATAEKMAALLVRQRVLLRVDTLLFHADALARLKAELAGMKAAAGGGTVRLDVGTFKERYGISRKFAIPLLEYLDRERVTRRVGDARVLI